MPFMFYFYFIVIFILAILVIVHIKLVELGFDISYLVLRLSPSIFLSIYLSVCLSIVGLFGLLPLRQLQKSECPPEAERSPWNPKPHLPVLVDFMYYYVTKLGKQQQFVVGCCLQFDFVAKSDHLTTTIRTF